MPTKKSTNAQRNSAHRITIPAQPDAKEAANLNLNTAIKRRGLKDCRELGYTLSGIFEHMLEKIHEYRKLNPDHKPGDPLQITFFDRLVEDEPKK